MPDSKPQPSAMSRPGFVFLVCPDAGLLRRQVDTLLADQAGALGEQYEFRVFWADEGLTDAFWQTLTLQGLMQKPKVLVLRRTEELNTEDSRRLSVALSKASPTTWPLICIESPWDRGKPKIPQSMAKQKCFEFAKKKNWIWQSAGLSARELRRWIEDWARESELDLEPGSLESLAAALPSDALAVKCELEKIRLASTGVVTRKAAQLVSHSTDIDIFSFLNALQKTDDPTTVWRKVLSDSEDSGDLVFPFLGLLAREARVLWQLLVGEQVWVPNEVKGMKNSLARRLGFHKLGRIFDLAVEAEMGIKTGRRRPDQALEALVADLSRLFSETAP